MNFKLIESTINTPSPTDANGSSTFQHNKLRKNKHLADIQLLKKSKKYVVIAMNGNYQFRISGKLDVYPTNSKYHHIKKEKRGTFESIDKLISQFFKK